MTEQQKQQYFMQQRRRQTLYRYHSLLTKIQNIRNAIAKGINPAEDPELKVDYFEILTQFGPSVFAFEHDNKAFLTKEED